MSIAYIALTVALLAAAATAVLSKNLLRSAVALGIGSVARATLFFFLGAPYAGGFELSLGAGLISVQFPFAPAELPAGFRGRVTIVDETLCKGCGLCARDCPALALELDQQNREQFRLIHYRDRCAYCGQCADSCPSHVITLSNELVSSTQERDTLTQVLAERVPDSKS